MKVESRIVRAEIYPSIGIARVGNSRESGQAGYFVGPEASGEATLGLGEYKDADGALKRQAARFRIFGFDSSGNVVAELTPGNAEIEWTVHLANKKAGWYQFQIALDIPQASSSAAPVSRRRNPQVTGADRAELMIDPGPRSIRGVNTEGARYRFNSGSFMKFPVDLGEIRTDEQGRLLVLGGYGQSRSIASMPPLDFANNDGWHDDISDGPVEAQVTVDARIIPVLGAWAVVAPPNYAPGLRTVRSLYDVLYDVGSRKSWGWYPRETHVSFSEHIQPLFERLSQLQWVNQGFAAVFGAGAPYSAPVLMARLADASPQNTEFRQQIFSRFRPLNGTQADASLWPYLYGDGLDDPTSVRSLATLSGVQYERFQKWSVGDFENDFGRMPPPPTSIDKVPLHEQPAQLDRAALDLCLADAFHPGCELTWVMRQRSLYSSRLRIRRRPVGMPEPDHGEILSPDIALSPNGPLSMSSAGDLTRWMAVPWQTDTASCLSGYAFFKTSDSLPTFWPARVPNDVLTEADFQTLMNSDKTFEERCMAFLQRKDWFRSFNGHDEIEMMILNFHKLGIIEERLGPTDLPVIPRKVWVESKPALPAPMTAASELAPAVEPKRFLLRRFKRTTSLDHD
ncbi:LodA/GoxA family CTQ-dependent oxidase [Paraburkholderia sp. RL17-347-BIC-D]|uniref:LodA/GoxA family CTQ-dependent oxidase n=1 Tax=Paraburkholderia sp. RL17-347-BIC-D TaxID=3031632 RepID=UPI0038B8D29B